MNRKIYLTIAISLIFSAATFGQSNFGEIRGKVTDASTKSPLDFLTLIVKMDGLNKGGAYTDEDGTYNIKALPPGDYTVTAKYVGYSDQIIPGVVVTANNITYVNIEMTTGAGNVLTEAVVTHYKVPLVQKDKNQKSFSSKDLQKLPTRSLGAIAETSSAVNRTAGGGISFLGQRTDATRVFVDGVAVIGSSTLPQASQGQIDIIQSGIPAQFGDFTGGAINITTKGPSRLYRKSFEVYSSSMFDPYHTNQAEASISGPLIIKNKGGGDKEYVALGFQLAGNVNYALDPSPNYGGSTVVKDDVLEQIEKSPLVANPQGSGLTTRSSFLTDDDLIHEKAKQNTDRLAGVLQGKLEFQPNKNSTITLYASGNYSRRKNYSYNQSLMNYKENSEVIDQTYRTYIKFTQRLRTQSADDVDKKAKKPLLSDAFYTVRADYQTRLFRRQNPRHKDDIFAYGYLGAFTHYRVPVYGINRAEVDFIDQNGDTVRRRNFVQLSGYTDTLITFERSELNPFRANYTTNYFDNQADLGNTVMFDAQIQSGLGLLNGQSIPNTYSLWYNPGTNNVFFEKSQQERFSAYAMGEASLNLNDGKNPHDLQFGMLYEQNISSRYAIGGTGLWTLMPQLANAHLTTLDNKPIDGYVRGGVHHYDENGRFLDTVSYGYQIDPDQQKAFDRNLRAKLISEGRRDVNGNLINESSWIDVNSLSPDDLNVNLFSADDLWNNGNTYISYYGYNHLGERERERPTLADFLYNKDERKVGSYAPVYSAAWLQDKFAFKDLIFRVGVRIEYFDANQLVLADPYSLFPLQTAAEVKDLQGQAIEHPSTVGDDYVVYVNNTDNPSKIVGYRKDNIWYDAEGLKVSTPDLIAQETSSGKIQPLLVDPEEQEIVKASFKDYEPQINVLPRVWFSFPINTEAQFFANYDVLAQRPANVFTPITTFFFLEDRQGGTISNGSLKPRIRTAYELGFKQKLSDNSALSLIASYSETKNDFGLIRLYHAYPVTYNHTANIDFSTVKSFRAEYEIRGVGRMSLSANYSLLFADGTGSNVNAAAALLAANQPNLRSLYPLDLDVRHKIVAVFDYRFKGGAQYTGPTWFGKKMLQNFGANFVITAKSGAPYTKNAIATSTAQASLGRVQRSPIDGNPFGSRMPWQFRIDMNAQKAFSIKKKNPKDKFRPQETQFVAFLWIQNIFNNQIVRSVYRYTGLPNDDGYLNSPQGQQYVQEQINARSFTDLYSLKADSPSNYLAPRLARLGLRMYF
jgi:hypothetical protein